MLFPGRDPLGKKIPDPVLDLPRHPAVLEALGQLIDQAESGVHRLEKHGDREFPLAIDVELQVTESLREIEAADDDVDRVLASRAMDVRGLIEDEVILALPMVPRHERCVAVGAGVTAKISPFSALAALKRGDKRR